jgi:hypothetical protein
MLPALLAMAPGIMSMIGGAAGLFGSHGKHGKSSAKSNPAYAANQQLDKIPGQVNPYYQPYINRGQQAGDQLTGQYNQMTGNPGELYASLGKGYQESPGYQFKLQQALNAQGNASARGGMLGTPQDQQYSGQIAHDLSNQDFEDYMNHVLGIYGAGQAGQQQQQQQGFDASKGYGDILGNIGGQKAQNSFAGQDFMNQNNKTNWGNIFSGAGQAAGSYFSSPILEQMFNKYMKGGH